MAKAKKELWRNRKIETKRMRVGDVLPHPMNPKIHGENQLAPLRGLLETVGKLDDLKAYYSERNEGKLTFFDGHGRMSLDPAEEWDVDVYDLTDAEADLAVATFDPIAYQAQMSRERLDELLREVSTGDEGLQKLISEMAEKEGLYLSETGAGEIGAGGDDFDATPEETQTRVRYGDLWQLGEHRLLCGDSTKAADVAKVMDGHKADMVFADPPYGINEETDRAEHVKTFKKQGVAKKGVYEKIIGDTNTETAEKVWDVVSPLSNTVIYWGGNYYPLPPSACWIVWDKRVEEKQTDLNSDAELAYVKHPHKASVRMFRHLWKGMIKGSEHGEARCHPTQKPVVLAEWCFENYGDPKTVLDPFGGSGMSLIACERTNRKARVIEIEPKYVNVILSRYEAETGQQAKLLDRING